MFDDRINMVYCHRIRELRRLGIIDADDFAADLSVELDIHGFVHVRAPQDEPAAMQVEEDLRFLCILEAVPQLPDLAVFGVDEYFEREPTRHPRWLCARKGMAMLID